MISWCIKSACDANYMSIRKIFRHKCAARLADDINAKLGRPLQYQNRGRIEYLITVNGPEPHEYLNSPIDYQHYIDKQLKPVADAILPFIGTDFEQLSAPQMGLF